VRSLLPHYVYQVGKAPSLGGKLVLAAPELAPRVTMKAVGDGRTVTASVEASGGTGPYTYQWTSGTTRLTGETRSPRLAFTRAPRAGTAPEPVVVTVTDANGITTTARTVLSRGIGRSSVSVPGGVGGELASSASNRPWMSGSAPRTVPTGSGT
jgi:hypothetical protein